MCPARDDRLCVDCEYTCRYSLFERPNECQHVFTLDTWEFIIKLMYAEYPISIHTFTTLILTYVSRGTILTGVTLLHITQHGVTSLCGIDHSECTQKGRTWPPIHIRPISDPSGKRALSLSYQHVSEIYIHRTHYCAHQYFRANIVPSWIFYYVSIISIL